jgi:hypothetical protein
MRAAQPRAAVGVSIQMRCVIANGGGGGVPLSVQWVPFVLLELTETGTGESRPVVRVCSKTGPSSFGFSEAPPA